MRRKVWMLAILAAGLAVGCGKQEKTAVEPKSVVKMEEKKEESKKQEEIPFLREMKYSNLVDEGSREYVAETLEKAGIQKKYVEEFLEQVKMFNGTVDTGSFVKEGFVTTKELATSYDVEKIMETWEKKYPDFIGNNCRITTFGLMKDIVTVGNVQKEKEEGSLFMDEDAIHRNPIKPFDEREEACFYSLFSSVKTELTKEIEVHLKKLKEDWEKKGVRFDESVKAKMISVVFHSALSEEENEIFIGHVGVLAPTEDGKFLFVEKLTFNEPYQAILFEKKQGVNDYLMNRYDIEWNQPTASPMVLENGELIEGYRGKKK